MGCHTWVYKKIRHFSADDALRVKVENHHEHEKLSYFEAYQLAQKLSVEELHTIIKVYCAKIAVELNSDNADIAEKISSKFDMSTQLSKSAKLIGMSIAFGVHEIYYKFEDVFIHGDNDVLTFPDKNDVVKIMHQNFIDVSNENIYDKFARYKLKNIINEKLHVIKFMGKPCLFEEVCHNPFRLYNAYDASFENREDLINYVMNNDVYHNYSSKEELIEKINQLYSEYNEEELFIKFG